MNQGIEELKEFADDFDRRKHREDFQESVVRQLYDDRKIMPIGVVEYDVPYVRLTMRLEDFKKHFKRIGFKPSWDLNWGNTLYCICARIDWKNKIAWCEFQSESEYHNMPEFRRRMSKIVLKPFTVSQSDGWFN